MYKNYFKRIIDFTLSLLGLLILSPLFLLLWLLLSMANKGAGAFFTQVRPGRNEKIFKVIKLFFACCFPYQRFYDSGICEKESFFILFVLSCSTLGLGERDVEDDNTNKECDIHNLPKGNVMHVKYGLGYNTVIILKTTQ